MDEGNSCCVTAGKFGKNVFWSYVESRNYVINFMMYLKRFFKASVVSAAWFLLSAYDKMQEERDALKEELSLKKGKKNFMT